MRAKVDPNLSHGYRLMIKNETHITNENGYMQVKFKNILSGSRQYYVLEIYTI